MSWEDRLRPAVYISPLGFRSEFLYEDVSRSRGRKTSVVEFPFAKGSLVQDFGTTGYRLPLRLFFSGPDYDRAALSFEASLSETGVGRLEHPIYGTVNVVPAGDFTRNDALKTQANQGVIEVTFFQTLLEIYAGSFTDIADIIFGGLTLYNEAASNQLNAEIILDRVTETTAFKSLLSTVLHSATNQFKAVLSSSSSVATAFSQVKQSMIASLEGTAAPDVATLGSQAAVLSQFPAKAVEASASNRLSSYVSAISVITGEDNTVSSDHDNRNANSFFIRDIFVASYLTGMVITAVNSDFFSRLEAIDAANLLITVFDSYVLWRDSNYEILAKDDTGDMYPTVQELVSLTVGYLVDLSFTLQLEKKLTLVSPRSVIDLVAELYGEVDEKIDFFINSNNLSGSEILELPRGREIVYYV